MLSYYVPLSAVENTNRILQRGFNMDDSAKPDIGETVEISYNIWQEGQTGKRTSVTLTVKDHTVDGFVAGPGIGTKVSQGSVFAPTSSDGYTADGEDRVKVGFNAEWKVVEEPV